MEIEVGPVIIMTATTTMIKSTKNKPTLVCKRDGRNITKSVRLGWNFRRYSFEMVEYCRRKHDWSPRSIHFSTEMW